MHFLIQHIMTAVSPPSTSSTLLLTLPSLPEPFLHFFSEKNRPFQRNQPNMT